MIRIPARNEDWAELLKDRRFKVYPYDLLLAIFGTEFPLRTLEILLGDLDPLRSELYSPIQAFLRLVAARPVLEVLVSKCLEGRLPPASLECACRLLTSLDDVRALDRLSQFAQSGNARVRRCGIDVLDRLVMAGLPEEPTARAAAEMFRPGADAYMTEVLTRIDWELDHYHEPFPRDERNA